MKEHANFDKPCCTLYFGSDEYLYSNFEKGICAYCNFRGIFTCLPPYFAHLAGLVNVY